jgi:hypothetical protein
MIYRRIISLKFIRKKLWFSRDKKFLKKSRATLPPEPRRRGRVVAAAAADCCCAELLDGLASSEVATAFSSSCRGSTFVAGMAAPAADSCSFAAFSFVLLLLLPTVSCRLLEAAASLLGSGRYATLACSFSISSISSQESSRIFI